MSIYDGGHVTLNWFNGSPYNLKIGAGGIHIYGSRSVFIEGRGHLTSSQRFLDIQLDTEGSSNDHLFINTVIVDNWSNKVGLRITGKHRELASVVLQGSQSNTFSGGVEVSGFGNRLSLSKTNGATAIGGNILLKDGGHIFLRGSRQIAHNSTVTMSNGSLQFKDDFVDKREDFYKLVIEKDSIIQWGSKYRQRYLYLDELVISEGALLQMQNWKEGGDFLLVKRSSRNLDTVLKRIRFQGYDPNATHLEDYNKDYLAISGTPEPVAYGAILSGGAIGLVLIKRKWRGGFANQ